ncbi:MAG TPA: hypothetical protein VFM90_03115, partial [Cyclobacteriaceae bacterium]|nr:hypothetical protein [Cyclobacteriaceae bacterium]
DLGLSPFAGSGDLDSPYNSEFYFVAGGAGDTIPIVSVVKGDYMILNDNPRNPGTPGVPGKIVTSKTREVPGYGYLPVYNPNSCVNYSFLTDILVPHASVDASYDILDTVIFEGKSYAKIQEAVLYRPNPNHYNIEIKFWQVQGNNFVEYDWFEEYCITFNGRFTTSLRDLPTYPTRPIEGNLRYAMGSTSFRAVFGNSQLRISARIRDRALNVSNTVYTDVFYLDRILD